MELLKYSSDPLSELNVARRSYWTSRHMLGCATLEPEKYDVKFWLRQQSPDLAKLRRTARELRAKLPTKKLYRVALSGDHIKFETWVRAHSRTEAMHEAANRYSGFKIDFVEQEK